MKTKKNMIFCALVVFHRVGICFVFEKKKKRTQVSTKRNKNQPTCPGWNQKGILIATLSLIRQRSFENWRKEIRIMQEFQKLEGRRYVSCKTIFIPSNETLAKETCQKHTSLAMVGKAPSGTILATIARWKEALVLGCVLRTSGFDIGWKKHYTGTHLERGNNRKAAGALPGYTNGAGLPAKGTKSEKARGAYKIVRRKRMVDPGGSKFRAKTFEPNPFEPTHSQIFGKMIWNWNSGHDPNGSSGRPMCPRGFKMV